VRDPIDSLFINLEGTLRQGTRDLEIDGYWKDSIENVNTISHVICQGSPKS